MKPEHIATIREALEMARHEIAEDTEYLEMHLRHSPVFVTRQQELKSSCIAIDAALAALDKLTPRYSHRNGETEPPTVDGWYWWSGTVIGAYAEKGLVNITVPRNDANIQIWPSWCDGWLGAKDMQGQWYGPIVPPWEDCHE